MATQVKVDRDRFVVAAIEILTLDEDDLDPQIMAQVTALREGLDDSHQVVKIDGQRSLFANFTEVYSVGSCKEKSPWAGIATGVRIEAIVSLELSIEPGYYAGEGHTTGEVKAHRLDSRPIVVTGPNLEEARRLLREIVARVARRVGDWHGDLAE